MMMMMMTMITITITMMMMMMRRRRRRTMMIVIVIYTLIMIQCVFPLVFQAALSLPREDPPTVSEVKVLPQAYEMVVVWGRAVG